MNTATQINHTEVRDAFIAYYNALANKAEKTWPSMVAHNRFLNQCEARLDVIEAKIERLEKFRF